MASSLKIYLSLWLIVLQMSPLSFSHWPSLTGTRPSQTPWLLWHRTLLAFVSVQSPSSFQLYKEKPTCSLAACILIAQGALPSPCLPILHLLLCITPSAPLCPWLPGHCICPRFLLSVQTSSILWQGGLISISHSIGPKWATFLAPVFGSISSLLCVQR